MNNLQYGIKLWSINSSLYEEFIKHYDDGEVDYLELLYIPGRVQGIQILIDHDIPIVVHGPTFNQKVLFGDGRTEYNTKMLLKTFNFSKTLNSNDIIIHPDVGEKNKFINFLKLHTDKKLIIENMPKKAIGGGDCLGYTVEDMKEFLSIGNFNFCLDIGHAIKSAISQKINYKPFLEKIIKLNPKIIHLSDGKLSSEEDDHLSLGDGNFDLKFIADIIKSSTAEKITLEVPKKDRLNNDIKNINLFKSLLD